MKLSVIIVNYNVKELLEQCLISVLRASARIETEIFVVDNNSNDGSVIDLQPFFPEVRFLINKENVGYSKANNQAIRIASGEYILLLNPDTVVGETLFERCLAFMDAYPEAGAAGVKMIDRQGCFHLESKRSFPSPWNSLCKIAGISKLFPYSRFFGRYNLQYLDPDYVHEVEVLCGAFMLMRKKALDRAGLLDETFFMYGEDIDLSYRILTAGFKNYYLPYPLLHYKGESTRKESRTYVKHFYGAMQIFYTKHYPNANILFRSFIQGAIFFRGSMSYFKRFFVSFKRLNKTNVKLNQKIEVLTDCEYRVDEMLQLMYRSSGVEYKIELRREEKENKQVV